MKTPNVFSLYAPVSLLLIVGLLSATACAGDSAHQPPYGKSGSAHARNGHHGGMHEHHGMQSAGHEHPHANRHGGDHRGKHAGGHLNAARFIDHILQFRDGMSLTDDQMRQLRAIKTQYRKARVAMKADIALANIDLHEVAEDETASLADIEAQLNTMHALKTKLYLASITAKRDANALLSEEQKSRMDKIHERIKSHGGKTAHQGGRTKHRDRTEYEKH